MTKYIVTANRLNDGEVVYLKEDRSWSTELSESGVFETKDDALEIVSWAEQSEQMRLVVGPYEMEVEVAGDGLISPIGQREIIRSLGPTVHPHFGKQAR